MTDYDNASFYEAALLNKLNITELSEPPIEEFIKYYNEPRALTSQEKQSVENFAISIIILEDSKTSPDIAAKYIAKFLHGFCADQNNFHALNAAGQSAIESMFEAKSSLLKKAVQYSNCP